jgi:hypothetical protein
MVALARSFALSNAWRPHQNLQYGMPDELYPGTGGFYFCNIPLDDRKPGSGNSKGRLMSELHRITINPEQCGGRPCLRALRVRVSDVLDLLAAGATPRKSSPITRIWSRAISLPPSSMRRVS